MTTINKVTLANIETEMKIQKPDITIEYDSWLNATNIWHSDFRYNIFFGYASDGWSYNDDQGFGYGDFINDLSTAKEIVEVFFKQVAENPQLTYEKAE